ncbi:LacI family transcriptional regulator [Bailinhaonella thermotolerans]|uniref:LacI family transcriptional regulator n=2 Tax=Bailinhaonella thermotolerans TaxID=1070861 RepID=A0A3A4AVS1_9ACTN|nr:LacI family transcriptional regulator [Bailinhaonella thermotolerans]
MKDVALLAGVALKTVSRVVNEEPGVNPATAVRVREAIERLGYRRNEGARLLRSGRTASIGLVIEDVGDPFYSGLFRAVEDVARRHGSLVFAGSSGEDPVRERELVLAFCARRVDGLVVVPAGEDHAYLGPELAAGMGVVFADRPAGNLAADTVLVDNRGGARAGTAHLISYGHRRIAWLGDSPAIFTAAERLRGYRTALAEAGLPYDPCLVASGATTTEAARAALDRMSALADPPTAIFTGNGRATIAALRALGPRRYALAGFDDFEPADLLGVTVVAQDPVRLGHTAAGLLFARLAGDRDAPREIVLPTRLIPRGSAERPPA